jgi:ABC-type lipoprotein export system ATPase subunit
MRVVRRLHRQRGLTVVMVTHDQRVAEQADRVVRLRDGSLLRDA